MNSDQTNSFQRVSQADIAKKVGVNASTVSRALRDDPRITERVRAEILKAARELGYRPDPAVSALANYRWKSQPREFSGVVAWITVENSTKELCERFPEFKLYWEGAKACSDRHGYRLEAFTLSKKMPLDRLEGILDARGVRGLLLPPEWTPFDDWERLHASNFSIVRLSRTVHNIEAHLVTTNQTADGLLASRMMRERGYKRVGFVGTKHPQRLFYPGFAWGQHNLADSELIPPLFLNQIPEEQRAEALVQWVERNQPDAILEDLSGFYDLVERCGFSIPGDFAVATQNALPNPGTAGILQNLHEVGRVGMLQLISLINDHDRGIPKIARQVQVKGRWVDGETLPPRNS